MSLVKTKQRTMWSGTVGYLAPETIEAGNSNEKTDIFSCGIVLYYMLTGILPFHGANSKEMFEENKRNNIDYEYLEEIGISRKGINFIKKLTQSDPRKRPNAFQALNDNWILG